MKKKVLMAVNDQELCRKIKCALQDKVTSVCYALSAEDVLSCFLKHFYCLVVIDIHLLGEDVFKMLKIMRQSKPVPILMLTDKLRVDDRTALLKAGATACIEEPLDIQECIAQARSLMDLYTAANPVESRYHTLAFGTELIIDPTYWQVTLNGIQIELTRKEFDLLYCLASRAGQAVTHEQIYNQVWRSDSDINVEGTIKTHISSLRQKLSEGGREYIESVRGVGYRFIADG